MKGILALFILFHATIGRGQTIGDGMRNFNISLPFIQDSIIVKDSTGLFKSLLIYDSNNSNTRVHIIDFREVHLFFYSYDPGFVCLNLSLEPSVMSYVQDETDNLQSVKIQVDSLYAEISFTRTGEIHQAFYCDYRVCNMCYDYSIVHSSMMEYRYLPFVCGGTLNFDIYGNMCQIHRAFPILKREYFEGRIIKETTIPYSEAIKR